MKLFLGLIAGLAALLLMAGCSDNEESSKISVTLTEYAITLDKTSVPEGPIDFTIKNDGEKQHEVIILRTDIPADQLPTKNDGSVDTGAADVHEEKKAEEIEDGDDTGRTFELSAGNYVLIDNTVEDQDGTKVSYYDKGMRVALTVTPDTSGSATASTAASSTSAATPTPKASATATPKPSSS